MKAEYYRQCDLRRVNGSREMAWIPEQFATRGAFLKIKRDGTWENGWEVLAVYARRAADQVIVEERDYLHQREASDV